MSVTRLEMCFSGRFPIQNVAKETHMKRFLGSVALATVIAGFAPQTAFADGRPFQGSFAVAFSGTPNTDGASYCGAPLLPRAVEAHGNGYSSFGPLSFTLFKTLGPSGLHGCLTLTAPNGDILEATWVGTGAAANANKFAPGTGAFTFTGGTGRFKNATGSGTWTAMFDTFYVASSSAVAPIVPVQGMAFYEVQGTVHRGKH